MKTLIEKYPVGTPELLHFPLMYPDSLKKYRIPSIPYITLPFLYDYAAVFGITKGTVRTTLSRMKNEGNLYTDIAGGITRYRVSDLQLSIMNDFMKRKQIRNKGFLIAVYSFEKPQEKLRAATRSLLQYSGFVRFAQNAYINITIDEEHIRASLKSYGVDKNVYLFKVNNLNSDELERMKLLWEIPERNSFLKQFLFDITTFIDSNDGSDSDIFYRIGVSWTCFIIHVHSSEPPLPDTLLPKDYAYHKISSYLAKTSASYAMRMIRFWKKINSI